MLSKLQNEKYREKHIVHLILNVTHSNTGIKKEQFLFSFSFFFVGKKDL